MSSFLNDSPPRLERRSPRHLSLRERLPVRIDIAVGEVQDSVSSDALGGKLLVVGVDVELATVSVSKPALSVLGDRARKEVFHVGVFAPELLVVWVHGRRPEPGVLGGILVDGRDWHKWMLR